LGPQERRVPVQLRWFPCKKGNHSLGVLDVREKSEMIIDRLFVYHSSVLRVLDLSSIKQRVTKSSTKRRKSWALMGLPVTLVVENIRYV